jgi:hypothetical protein
MKQKTIRPLVKKYSPRWWKSQITQADRRYEKFIKSADESIKVFNGVKEIETLKDAPRRLNVWWYCVNTLLPAYYSSTPKAEVNLRKRAGGLPYELGSVILERNTQYSMDCHFSFDKVGYNAALQFLLTGQAVLWARYAPKFEKVFQEIAVIRDPSGVLIQGDGTPYEGDTEGFSEATNGILVSSVEVEQKVSEKAILEVVQFSDYRCSDARNEAEIEWQARRAFLGREEATALFGEEKADKLNYDSIPEVNKRDASRQDEKFEGKAEIWEIWCEATNKVYWIQTGNDDVLIEETEPPIKFEGFYPCSVIRQTQDPNSVIPVSDFSHVKDQILEVERLTTRIHALTQAVRPNFLYDAAMGDYLEQLFQDDLKGIGVTGWTANKGRGGLQGGMEFLPVEQFVNVLNTLQQNRQAALQQLYETLKVSDLLRGTSEQYKSATANRLESAWSSLGLIVRQNMFCKFISDAIMHLGTIIAEQFDEQRIMETADADALIEPTIYIPAPPSPPPAPEPMPGQEGMPPDESGMMPQGPEMAPPPMEPPPPPQPDPMQLVEEMKQQIISIFRDNTMRNYRIEIASDSMVAIDQQQQQQEGTMLLQAAGGFFDQMRGLVEQYPPLAQFSLALFQNFIKRFKGGKEVDGLFSKAFKEIEAIAKAKEEAAKQPPPPDPKTLEIQGRMQIAQVESQARLQATQMEMQDKAVKNQLAYQDQQLKMQRDQLESQLRVQEQQFKEYMEQQRLAIDQQEVQVKAQAVQVDMLKVQSSAQTEADKNLIKQETQQMAHILEIQRLELENMRIKLSESEKLMEERRLASEQALERVRLQMEQVNTPKLMSMGGMTGRKKSGKIITDDNGNPTAIEITEQPEVKVQRITLDEEGNPSGIELE